MPSILAPESVNQAASKWKPMHLQCCLPTFNCKEAKAHNPTEGISALPKNCLKLCYGFFCAAILINIIRDALGKKRGRFIPLPMAMAIPFYLGSYFAIDMCVGSLILYTWQRINKAKADAFAPAVASGLICGDGMWTLPSSILALTGVKPPICMKFLSRSTNRRVDKFLGS